MASPVAGGGGGGGGGRGRGPGVAVPGVSSSGGAVGAGVGCSSAVDGWQPPSADVGWLGVGPGRLPRKRRPYKLGEAFRPLRLVTLNCGTCIEDGRLESLRAYMECAACDVLAVQETRARDAAALLSSWRRVWPGAWVIAAPADALRAGVALFLPPEMACHRGCPFACGGEVAACTLNFGGTTLCVASLYAPQQGAASRATRASALVDALDEWLGSASRRSPGQRRAPLVCVLGDFNECIRGAADRWSSTVRVSADDNDSTVATWAAATGLRDIYGRQHPLGDGAPGFTFLSRRSNGCSASRLDYAVGNGEFLARCLGCEVDYADLVGAAVHHCALVVDIQIPCRVAPRAGKLLAPRQRVATLSQLRDDAARERASRRLEEAASDVIRAVDAHDLEGAAALVVGAFSRAMRPEAGGLRLVRGAVACDWPSLPRAMARAIRRAEVVLEDARRRLSAAVRQRWRSCCVSCGRHANLPSAPALPCLEEQWQSWRIAALAALEHWRDSLRREARACRRKRIRLALGRRLNNFARSEELASFVRGVAKRDTLSGGHLIDSVFVDDGDGRRFETDPFIVADAARKLFKEWTGRRSIPWVENGMPPEWAEIYEHELPGMAPSETAYADLMRPISVAEYHGVLTSVRKRSAAGPSGMGYRHLAELSPEHKLHRAVLLVLNFCVERCHVPKALRHGILRPVPKRDYAGDLNQTRPICLLESCLKILTRVLGFRLEQILTQAGVLPGDNLGFARGHSPAEAVLALRAALEDARERKVPLAAALVDITRAFDRTPRPSLMKTFSALRVPRAFTDLLGSLYDDFSCRVQTANGLSEPYTVENGVIQGEVTSPLCWNLFALPISLRLRAVARLGARTGAGYSVAAGRGPPVFFSHLIFADDIALLATSSDGLELLLQVLAAFCALHGLDISLSKSFLLNCLSPSWRAHERGQSYPRSAALDLMTIGNARVLRGNVLQPDQAFLYLGATMTGSLSVAPQLRVLRERALADCASLGRRMLTAPMIRFLVTGVMWPRALYALSLHPVTPAQLGRLQVPVLQWARHALHVPSTFPTSALLAPATFGLVGLSASWDEHVVPELEYLLSATGLGARCVRARLAQWRHTSGVHCVLRCPAEVAAPTTWLECVASALSRCGLGLAKSDDDPTESDRWLVPARRMHFGTSLVDTGLTNLRQIVHCVGGVWRFTEMFERARLSRDARAAVCQALAEHGVILPGVVAALMRAGLGRMPFGGFQSLSCASTDVQMESWKGRLQCDGDMEVSLWSDGSCMPATALRGAVMSAAVVVESGAHLMATVDGGPSGGSAYPGQAAGALSALVDGAPHSTGAELAAILGALRVLPSHVPAVIYCDNSAAIRVAERAKARATSRVLGVFLRQALRSGVRIVEEQIRQTFHDRGPDSAPVRFVHVPAHTGRADFASNARADEAARALSGYCAEWNIRPERVLLPRGLFLYVLVHTEGDRMGGEEACPVWGDPRLCVRRFGQCYAMAVLRLQRSCERVFARNNVDWAATLQDVRVDHASRWQSYAASRVSVRIVRLWTRTLPVCDKEWVRGRFQDSEMCPRCECTRETLDHVLACTRVHNVRRTLQIRVDGIMQTFDSWRWGASRRPSCSLRCLAVSEDRLARQIQPLGLSEAENSWWIGTEEFSALDTLAGLVPAGLCELLGSVSGAGAATARAAMRRVHKMMVFAFSQEIWQPRCAALVERRQRADAARIPASERASAAGVIVGAASEPDVSTRRHTVEDGLSAAASVAPIHVSRFVPRAVERGWQAPARRSESCMKCGMVSEVVPHACPLWARARVDAVAAVRRAADGWLDRDLLGEAVRGRRVCRRRDSLLRGQEEAPP